MRTKEEIIDDEFSENMINKYSEGEMKFIKDAMDEYGKEMCMQLLEWMAKQDVKCDPEWYSGRANFAYNGKDYSAEELFNNFL